jgi:thioredoxin reductase
MIGTVDLVIAGDASAAGAAAVTALQRGQRVLVVLRSADARVARRLRRRLLKTARADGGQLRIMTNAEVVCADGVDGVEAVVVRHAPTGRLSAVNASAFVSFDASSQSRRLRSKHENEPRSRKSSLTKDTIPSLPGLSRARPL